MRVTINGDGKAIPGARVIRAGGQCVRLIVHDGDSVKNRLVLRRLVLQLTVPLLLAAIGGGTFFQDGATPMPGPRLYEKGGAPVGGVRDFDQRIGFRPPDKFFYLDKEGR